MLAMGGFYSDSSCQRLAFSALHNSPRWEFRVSSFEFQNQGQNQNQNQTLKHKEHKGRKGTQRTSKSEDEDKSQSRAYFIARLPLVFAVTMMNQISPFRYHGTEGLSSVIRAKILAA
jgi:hypothetical protein